MDIQKKVRDVIRKQLKTLGAEAITLNGEVLQAIPAEVDTDRELMGGSREQRDIDYQFPTLSGLEIRKGMAVQAQGKEWKVDSFQRGRAMTTIRLIEPNRVEV